MQGMTEASSKTDQKKKWMPWGKDKKCKGTDRETERVWQIVPWGCCRFSSSTCLLCYFLSSCSHTHQQGEQPWLYLIPSLYILYHSSFSCVGGQLCSSGHFELYRSVGDCVYVFAVILCLVNVHEQKVNISTGHTCYHKHTHWCNVSLCYWWRKKQLSWCKPIETHMQMNHGNTNNKPRLVTWFWWSKNTQKDELPDRSPELAVTKTQLSLGRNGRRRIWRFRVMFTVDLPSLYASLSWTDQHRQLRCQIITSYTSPEEAHRSLFIPYKHQDMGTLSLFLGLPSHPSSISIFVPFQTSHSLINLLIRNYANDPKKLRERVCVSEGVSVCVLWRACPKKIQPAEKSSSKAVKPSSSRLSSSSTPSWERRQGGGRERRDETQDQRVVALEAAWEKY